jgi:hypothetical protein
MRKAFLNRVFSVFLLVTFMVPVSIQFIHAFKPHSFHRQHTGDHDQIQNPEESCAIFHKQINHNAIDLYFDFELTVYQEHGRKILIPLTETHQYFIHKTSSRAPPALSV